MSVVGGRPADAGRPLCSQEGGTRTHDLGLPTPADYLLSYPLNVSPFRHAARG